jgi:hypothetical protein
MTSYYFINESKLPFLIKYWEIVPPISKKYTIQPIISFSSSILKPNSQIHLFSCNNSFCVSSLFASTDISYIKEWNDNGFENKKISYIENNKDLKIYNYDNNFVCKTNEKNEIIITYNE